MVFSGFVRNMVLILASLVSNGVSVLHLSFEFGMFLEEATFVSLSIRPSPKALPKTSVLTRELFTRLVSGFGHSFKYQVTVLESGLPP